MLCCSAFVVAVVVVVAVVAVVAVVVALVVLVVLGWVSGQGQWEPAEDIRSRVDSFTVLLQYRFGK